MATTDKATIELCKPTPLFGCRTRGCAMPATFGRVRCAVVLFVCAWCTTPHDASPHLTLPIVSRHRPEVRGTQGALGP